MARLGTPEPRTSRPSRWGPTSCTRTSPSAKTSFARLQHLDLRLHRVRRFRWEVRLTDTDSVIGSYQTKAWGEGGDTSRKSSGWQVVEIDTAAFQGRPASSSSAGVAQRTNLYAFWVYLDSAEETAGSDVVNLGEIKVNGFAPSQSPQTRTIFPNRPPGTGNNTISVPVVCPTEATPTPST